MDPNLMELIKLMDDRGLSVEQFTRLERSDGRPVPRGYNPASDIVNLLPPMLAASINDLEGAYPDEWTDAATGLLINQLLLFLYTELPGKDGNYSNIATKVSQQLRKLEEELPGTLGKLEHNMFYFSLVAYAIACKNGLREMPTMMGGNGVFRYFAMLGVWDKLKPETQEAVVKDLSEQNLWGATPDAE